MLRMEIALFLVVAFVAYMYFTAEKEHTALHKTFSVLLVAVLVHLALDGWLETTTGVGTRVANLNLADRFSYMQVRGAIEALAVRLCAENVTQEDLLALDHCLAVAKLVIDSGNLVRAIEADIDFHRLCAKCSKNRFLYQFYDRLLTQDELVFFRNVSDADIRIQSHEQHAAIVEAIRSGNPQQAEKASRYHTQTILDRLRSEENHS